MRDVSCINWKVAAQGSLFYSLDGSVEDQDVSQNPGRCHWRGDHLAGDLGATSGAWGDQEPRAAGQRGRGASGDARNPWVTSRFFCNRVIKQLSIQQLLFADRDSRPQIRDAFLTAKDITLGCEGRRWLNQGALVGSDRRAPLCLFPGREHLLLGRLMFQVYPEILRPWLIPSVWPRH